MKQVLGILTFFCTLNTMAIPRTMVWTVPDSVASGVHVMFMGRKTIEKRFNVPGGADLSAYLLEQCYREKQSAFEEIGCEVQFTDHPFIPFDDYYTRDDMSFLRVRVPDGGESEALKLVADLLQRARQAGSEEIQRAMRACLMANRMRRSTGAAAAQELKRQLFPDCYVSMPTYLKDPVENGVALQKFLNVYLAPENTVVTVVGSVDADQLASRLAELFGTAPLARPNLRCKTHMEDMAEQVKIRQSGGQGYVLMSAILPEPKTDVEWAALQLTARRISQRISFQLREKEGLAYSIGASIGQVAGNTMIQIHMGTAPAQVGNMPKRLEALVSESLHQPVEQDELERLCHSLLIDRRMKRLTNINKASFRSLDLLWGRDPGFEKRVDDALISMDLKTLRACLKKLRPDFRTILVNVDKGEPGQEKKEPGMMGMPVMH